MSERPDQIMSTPEDQNGRSLQPASSVVGAGCPRCGSLMRKTIWLPVVECSDCGQRYNRPNCIVRDDRFGVRAEYRHPLMLDV